MRSLHSGLHQPPQVNFRLDISRLHADFLIKEKQYSTALSFDQLGPIL